MGSSLRTLKACANKVPLIPFSSKSNMMGRFLNRQSNKIFLLPYFSLNGLSWSRYTCLKSILKFVEFLFSYLYIVDQKIDFLLSMTMGSRKFNLWQPIFFTLLKCSWWEVLYSTWIVQVLLHCPFKGKGTLSMFLKTTLRCQHWRLAINEAGSSNSP